MSCEPANQRGQCWCGRVTRLIANIMEQTCTYCVVGQALRSAFSQGKTEQCEKAKEESSLCASIWIDYIYNNNITYCRMNVKLEITLRLRT